MPGTASHPGGVGMMGRRSQYDIGRKALYLLVALFILTFIFFYTQSTFASYAAEAVDETEWIESTLILSELINYPACFTYFDQELVRAYPGVMDIRKLRSGSFGQGCLASTEREVFVRIGSIEVGEEPPESLSLKKAVLVRDGGDIEQKMMEVKVGTEEDG